MDTITLRAHFDGEQICLDEPFEFEPHTKLMVTVFLKADGQTCYTALLRDISERKRAEEDLRQSEARFRITADNAPVMIWQSGPDKGCTWFNKPWLDFVGRTMTQELGHGWTENVHPADFSRCLAIYTSAFDARQPFRMEYRLRRHDGEYRWILDSGVTLYGPAEEFTGYIGSCIDITERKQAEEVLHMRERAYATLIKNISGTVYRCRNDQDWTTEFISDGCFDITGYQSEELRENSVTSLGAIIHPDDAQPIWEKCQTNLAVRKACSNEYRIIHRSGDIRWVWDQAQGIYADNGDLLYIEGLITDITAHKQAQMHMEFQKTLLECQLEACLDGILIVSTERQWLYLNQRFGEMWGIPPEVAVTCSRLAALPYIRSLLAEPETSFADVEYLHDHPAEASRKEIALKDGRIFERYSAPIASAAGGYYGRLWSYRDISRRRQLEAQLLQAQKMEAIGQLAGGIAHDFNNILVPIIGYTELALLELSPDDKLYGDLQRVREAAERAAGLTRQILAFSRKQVLEMRTIDLNTLVMGFQPMMQRLIGEDIEVQTFLDPALYPVKADKGQIEQVLLNLVVNARDAMPQGGKFTLETHNVYLDEAYIKKYADAQAPGHYVMLAVSDTGQGMDAETQQHIFEPFFTTKEQGKGTGLGLATVFGIVKQHSGNIWVYSEPGKGTTFKIYLPRAEETTPLAPGEMTAPAAVHGTETVLVVEDETMVRELVGETLEAHGYKVIEAPSPAAGMQIAAGYQDIIHLLLTDVIMPEMNGRELYQKLATLRAGLKVLYMSGYTDNVIVHHSILAEGVNFLQKPFTVQSLTQKVRKVLS